MTKSSDRKNLSKAKKSKKTEKAVIKQPEQPRFPEEKPKHWLEPKQKIQENLLVKARDSRRLQMVSGKRGK